MSTAAQYCKNARQTSVSISTANTNRDGTGTMAILWTAAATIDTNYVGGSRIERVVIQATGTVTNGMVRLFVSSDAAANTSANTFLYEEVPITATTPSATTEAFSQSLQAVTYETLFPIVLGPGCTLRVSTEKAETFVVTAMGGDF